MLLILTYIHSRQSIVQTDSTTAIESFEILNEDLGLFKKTVPHLPWFIKPQKGLMPIKHMIKHQWFCIKVTDHIVPILWFIKPKQGLMPIKHMIKHQWFCIKVKGHIVPILWDLYLYYNRITLG